MNSPNPAVALYRDLPSSLEVYPHQIDLLQDLLLMLRVSAAEFDSASFLDQRLLGPAASCAWFRWEQVVECMAGQRLLTPAHYVFHVGHCGSTLVSRLLQEFGVTALREPLPLRSFAELLLELDAPHSRWSRDTFDSRLALLCKLFERGGGPRVVKASSFCNDLADPILAGGVERRATVVYARPRAHIANMMASHNSRLDLMWMAPARVRRLAARIGTEFERLADMSPGVVAAMSWTCEAASLAALLDAVGNRVHIVDFDSFLRDLRGSLRLLADHVVPGTTDELVERAASSPTVTRYAKAPENAYDAILRQQVLAEADRQWGHEIRAGLAWCERTAAKHELVARAMERFAGQ